MDKFYITEHEWSDTDLNGCRVECSDSGDLVHITGTDINDNEYIWVYMTKPDARALCQHFYGFDPETVAERENQLLLQIQRNTPDHLQKYAVVFERPMGLGYEVFNLDQAAFVEHKLNEKLIELGWAPPDGIDPETVGREG